MARRVARSTRQQAEAERAAEHRQTRQAHASELAEDYVEAIADLIDVRGEARVVDIARLLGVSHVSVVRAVARLRGDRLVTAEPYRAVFLTQAGRELAEHSKRRHRAVVQFLEAIGVSARQSRLDAEGIEHHVSEETLRAMEDFLRRRGDGRPEGVKPEGAKPEGVKPEGAKPEGVKPEGVKPVRSRSPR
jgi:DtxR family manganese transport transcriptional regulator